MPKVLILILSTTDSSYVNFIKSCKETWVKQAQEHGIPCIFYQGSAHINQLDGNELRLVVDDSLSSTGQKLIAALRFIEDSEIEYDYIFRTNLSSYIFIENFLRWVSRISSKDLYSGPVQFYNLNDVIACKYWRKFQNLIHPRNKIPFAEGAGFWISKGNVQKLLSDNALNFNLIDDVMVGESLRRQNVLPTPVSRIDYVCNGSITRTKISGGLEDMQDCYHVRIKSSDREFDATFFYKLHQYKNFAEFFINAIYKKERN